MKKALFAVGLLAASLTSFAKEKMIPLSEADAASLQGKTVALTLHERPPFSAMTAGKASFGLLGVAAMYSAGNKLIDENHVVDPAEIVRANLASALRDAYALQLLPVDTTATKAKKPKEIAALHPEADYVLDVRSGGWMYAYYPTRWGSYWVGYSVQVQLVDTKTGRQVSNVACNSNTNANPRPPSREQLLADGAKLLKDVTASLGWMCVQVLAKEQFKFAPGQFASTPAEYVDPLAALPSDHTGSTANAPAENVDQAGTVPGSHPAEASPTADDATVPAADAPAIDETANEGAGAASKDAANASEVSGTTATDGDGIR